MTLAISYARHITKASAVHLGKGPAGALPTHPDYQLSVALDSGDHNRSLGTPDSS
ncbi:hypothetical protein CERSUDRAFT_101222 [Gelatoporia subvermispora B]|uniref:Uncharacterized protein n=1 Tax=Ceriporiopsis subvermispora (strain B) TaxID=914234 RepID=M2QEY0_CERS8|nr:hypothetical protein CERSUDRAFT_101222 [Gelatoporia subvermispora B]